MAGINGQDVSGECVKCGAALEYDGVPCDECEEVMCAHCGHCPTCEEEG